MAYNLIECNREQMYLMPVSVRDWLSEGHLAWFMLDAVEEVDFDRRMKGNWGGCLPRYCDCVQRQGL